MARTRHASQPIDTSDPHAVLVRTLATGLTRLISAHSPICGTEPDSTPTSLELPEVPAVSVPGGNRPERTIQEASHER